MQESPPIPSKADIHEQVESLRGLAHALVGPADADDLLSSTYLKAIERPPKTGARIRGWLATVMRNEAIDQGRANQSRARREDRVCQPQRNWGPSEVIEDAEAKRILTQALHELDDKNQKLLVWRYFEQKTPAQIALELGISVPATRVRLTRAVGAMRRNLRAKYGSDWKGYCQIVVLGQSALIKSGGAGKSITKKLGSGLSPNFYLLLSAIFCVCLLLLTPLLIPPFEPLLEATGEFDEMGLGDVKDVGEISPDERISLPTAVGPATVFVMDHSGSPLPDAAVSILGDAYLWRGKAKPDAPGLFEIGPRRGLSKNREYMLLITCFGHAPFTQLVDSFGGHNTVKLPRQCVVSGTVDFSMADKAASRFLLLEIKEMQPETGSPEFEFRKQLSREQRDKFDQAFHSISAKISDDGSFEFDGLDANWEGAIAYQGQNHELVGSMEWGMNQVFWVHGPRSDIVLTLKERPYVDGWVELPDHIPDFENVRISSIRSEAEGFETYRVNFDKSTGRFRAYAKEFPAGPLTARAWILSGNVECPVQRVQGKTLEFRVDIPRGKQKKIHFLLESGEPAVGVPVRDWSNDVVAVSDEDGLASFYAYQDKIQLTVDEPQWLREEITNGTSEETIILKSWAGITFAIPDIPRMENAGQIGIGGFHLKFRCDQGLSSLKGADGLEVFKDQNWFKFEFDSASEDLVEFYTPIARSFPARVANLGICGDVECTLLNGEIPIWREVILLEEWAGNKVININAPPPEDRELDFQVLDPRGKPLRNGDISAVSLDGRSRGLGRLDGYGMGSSSTFGLESRVVFSQLGYHPSQIIRLRDLIDSQGGIIRVAPARTVSIDTLSFGRYVGEGELRYQCTRYSDGYIFNRGPGDSQFEIINCPESPFLTMVYSDNWEFEFPCPKGSAELIPSIPDPVKVAVLMHDPTQMQSRSISKLELVGPSGRWMAKSKGGEIMDDGSLSIQVPGFRDLNLVRVAFSDGTVSEVAPSFVEEDGTWKLTL